MLKKISTFAVSFLLSTASLFVLAPMVAHAATVTWSGASGTDMNWSTATNWVGGVSPTNGDTVVIDNAATFTLDTTIDDIPGLGLAGITFINNAVGGSISVQLAQNLSVTGPITQAASVTTTSNSIVDDTTPRTLTLGANVTINTNTQLNILSTGDTLDLGANTLTFNETSATSSIAAVSGNIIGTGGIVFNGAHTDYQLEGNNTYSGPTHIVAAASNGVYKTSVGVFNPFGSSTVTIEPAGHVGLGGYNASATINNTFIVTGTTNGSPVVSIDFGDDGTGGVVLTVPNIVLNGDTRFALDSTGTPHLSVNLAGITDNDHCVQYISGLSSDLDGPSNGFTNGPDGCIVSATVNDTNNTPPTPTPKTPDTGFALVKNNPIATLAATLTLAGAMIVIARRVSKTNR